MEDTQIREVLENNLVATQRKIRILSFDIGMRHLAYALIEVSSGSKIIEMKQWDVVDLYKERCESDEADCIANLTSVSTLKKTDFDSLQKKKALAELKTQRKEALTAECKQRRIHADQTFTTIDLIACKLRSFFGRHPEFLDCDFFGLENQPVLTNPVMKSVQMLIYSWFAFHLPKEKFLFSKDEQGQKIFAVKFIAAGNKNKLIPEVRTSSEKSSLSKEEKRKTTYKERKKAGIEHCLKFLPFCENPESQKEFFLQHTKKDDLADCFLQAVVIAKKFFSVEFL